MLNAAETIENIDLPGLGMHQLSGDLAAFYAVKVNKNWRIIFRLTCLFAGVFRKLLNISSIVRIHYFSSSNTGRSTLKHTFL